MDKGTGLLLVIAGTAAVILGRRSKATTPGQADTGDGDSTGGGDSTGEPPTGGMSDEDRGRTGQLDANWRVREALCKRPMNLSGAEQQQLRDNVIGPLYDAQVGQLSTPSAAEWGAFFDALALQITKCSNNPHPQSKRVASQMAQAVHWQRTGHSGQ